MPKLYWWLRSPYTNFYVGYGYRVDSGGDVDVSIGDIYSYGRKKIAVHA